MVGERSDGAPAAADGEAAPEISEDLRVRAAVLLLVLAPPLAVSMENPGAFFGVLQVRFVSVKSMQSQWSGSRRPKLEGFKKGDR